MVSHVSAAQALTAPRASRREPVTRYGSVHTVHPRAGQGVVQFARGAFNGREYAVKFCVIPSVFTLERSLYSDPALRSILPNIADVCPNDSGAVTDPTGNPVPPFIIMERGEALDEWSVRARPDVRAAAQARLSPSTPRHARTANLLPAQHTILAIAFSLHVFTWQLRQAAIAQCPVLCLCSLRCS